MPTVYPIELWAPDTYGNYPHMAKRDAEVWERYLADHGKEWVAFSYDVALGGRIIEGDDVSAEERRGWQYSTALKIDVVGWKGNQAWIIEVRPDASAGTIGAAITYAMVAKREELTALPLVPAICCYSIQPDVEWTCGQLGVQVLLVSERRALPPRGPIEP